MHKKKNRPEQTTVLTRTFEVSLLKNQPTVFQAFLYKIPGDGRMSLSQFLCPGSLVRWGLQVSSRRKQIHQQLQFQTQQQDIPFQLSEEPLRFSDGSGSNSHSHCDSPDRHLCFLRIGRIRTTKINFLIYVLRVSPQTD